MSARPYAAAVLTKDLEQGYLKLIAQRFGFLSSTHVRRELPHAIGRILAGVAYPDATALLAALVAGCDAEVLQGLGEQLSIGETHFFRVSPQIAALREVVLPELLRSKADLRQLRIWSAGCSTGEELYTLAILIRELGLDLRSWKLELIGSDVSRSSLELARQAIYSEWSFRDTPPEIRARYFTPEGKRWRLSPAIRDMARFVQGNLTDGLSPTGLAAFDLIICRNVTIYFNDETTQRVYCQFERDLAPGGWLVLGPSDPPPQGAAILVPVYLPGAVMWRHSPAATAPLVSSGGASTISGVQLPSSRPERARPRPAPALPRGVARSQVAPLRPAASPPPSPAPSLSPGEYLAWGLQALDEGDPGQALEHLRRSTFLSPENPLAQFSLALAHLRLGEPSRARALLAQTTRLIWTLGDEQVIPEGHGMRVGELRHALEAQLAALDRDALANRTEA